MRAKSLYRDLRTSTGEISEMNAKHAISIAVVAAAWLTGGAQLRAGVKVDTAQPVEMTVAFQVAPNKYVSTAPSNSLAIVSGKPVSKKIFSIIDISGGDLKDGDRVRIRYTPHASKTETGAEPPRPNYWLENSAGVRRGHDGDVFTLKRVDTKFAFVTPTGKFVAAPTNEVALGVSAKQEGALLVDIIDVKTGASVIKAPDQGGQSDGSAAPATGQPEGTSSPPPAAASAPAPSPDKPAAQ
jgi:hypothetical protein